MAMPALDGGLLPLGRHQTFSLMARESNDTSSVSGRKHAFSLTASDLGGYGSLAIGMPRNLHRWSRRQNAVGTSRLLSRVSDKHCLTWSHDRVPALAFNASTKTAILPKLKIFRSHGQIQHTVPSCRHVCSNSFLRALLDAAIQAGTELIDDELEVFDERAKICNHAVLSRYMEPVMQGHMLQAVLE